MSEIKHGELVSRKNTSGARCTAAGNIFGDHDSQQNSKVASMGADAASWKFQPAQLFTHGHSHGLEHTINTRVCLEYFSKDDTAASSSFNIDKLGITRRGNERFYG